MVADSVVAVDSAVVAPVVASSFAVEEEPQTPPPAFAVETTNDGATVSVASSPLRVVQKPNAVALPPSPSPSSSC